VSHSLRAHDRDMSTAKTSHITVELETGADPIRGSIDHADGRTQPFWGWLELIEALRRAAADQPEADAQPAPAESGQLPTPAAPAERRSTQTPREEHA
jgi:hypothetical protein